MSLFTRASIYLTALELCEIRGGFICFVEFFFFWAQYLDALV